MWEALKDDWLLASVRFAGVAVGIFGAGIASPDAARAVGRTIRSYVAARWWRLRALLRIPNHRDIYLADSVGASDAFGRNTVTVEASGSVWSDDPADQMEILRQRTERLERALQAVRVANHNDVAGVRAEVAALRNEHSTAFADMRQSRTSATGRRSASTPVGCRSSARRSSSPASPIPSSATRGSRAPSWSPLPSPPSLSSAAPSPPDANRRPQRRAALVLTASIWSLLDDCR